MTPDYVYAYSSFHLKSSWIYIRYLWSYDDLLKLAGFICDFINSVCSTVNDKQESHNHAYIKSEIQFYKDFKSLITWTEHYEEQSNWNIHK